MGTLVALAAGSFLELVTWLAKHLGVRLGLVVGSIAALAFLYGTMLIVVGIALSGVSSLVPDYVTSTLAIFVPSQTGAAMSAVMTARMARWVYEESLRVLAFVSAQGSAAV